MGIFYFGNTVDVGFVETMKELNISRREVMKYFAMGAGALAVGCQTVEATETPTQRAIHTSTYEASATLPSPTATEGQAEILTDDEIATRFGEQLWRAGDTHGNATLFEAIPIKKNGQNEWEPDEKKETESWYFDGVDFRITNVVSGDQFQGFVSGVTGDKRMYKVTLATKDRKSIEYDAQPLEKYIDPNRLIVSSYMYISGESIYLNKARNLGQTCQLLLKSMLERPIEKNGGEFSMLERIDAANNFFDKSLYYPGYATGYSQPVPAGGACGIASSTARMFAPAEAQGWGRKTEGQPHSEPVYLDLPFGGEEDEEDVTVFYHPNPALNQDLRWVNDSSRDLWIIPRISYFPFELRSKNYSTMWSPCPVRVAISLSLSTVAPTEEDLADIENKIGWLDEYVKENYGGYYQFS